MSKDLKAKQKDLDKLFKQQTLEITDKEKATYAFFSGLIMGWTSRLEKLTPKGHNVETFKIIEDMKQESYRLAKLAGLSFKFEGKKK